MFSYALLCTIILTFDMVSMMYRDVKKLEPFWGSRSVSPNLPLFGHARAGKGQNLCFPKNGDQKLKIWSDILFNMRNLMVIFFFHEFGIFAHFWGTLRVKWESKGSKKGKGQNLYLGNRWSYVLD